jgi:prepilin peptidase CpaA
VNLSTPSTPVVVTTVLLLVAATLTDVRSRRIPNTLTFPAIAAALVIRSLAGGWTALLWGAAGGVIAPLVLMSVRAFRRLGMGDVKLAVAVGVLLGPAAGAAAMLASAVFGGALALAVMLRPGSAGAHLLSPFFVGVPVLERVYGAGPSTPERGTSSPTLPYGVAISAGTLLTLAISRWI